MKKPAPASNDFIVKTISAPLHAGRSRRLAAPAWSYDRGHIVATVFGIWLAMGSASFAAYMLTHRPQEPLVNGMQHLAIFGMPNGSSELHTGSGDLDHSAGGDPKEIDFSGTGSIPEIAQLQLPELRFRATGGPISVIAGDRAVVWLQRGSVIIAVHVGDVVPGAGRVAGIARRAGHWAPIGDTGEPLVDETGLNAGSDAEIKGVSRDLIFRDE